MIAVHRRRRDDAGISLVETLVAGSLGVLVLSSVVAVFAGVMRTAHTVAVQDPSTDGARMASEELSRELRVAVKPRGVASALTVAKPDTVSFYALLNRSGAPATGDVVPTFVTYSFSGNCLRVTTVAGVAKASPPPAGPDYDWPGTGVTRCLLRTTVAPVFSYFATTAVATAAGAANDSNAITLPAAGLDATAIKTVQSVQVTITGRNPDDVNVATSSVKSRVTLANVVTS